MPPIQDEIVSLVRTDSQNLTLSDLLRRPTTAVLGINDEVAEALKVLDIQTVFDLATSDVFAAAAKVLEASINTRSLLYQHGAPTADLIRETVAVGAKVEQLKDLKIEALQRIPEANAATIAKFLDVRNIREFALWPPYRAAVKILNTVYFPENAAGFDLEQPADLLPKNGEYPTERVQYTTLVMDEIKLPNMSTKINILAEEFTPIDISRLAAGDAGFQSVAYGALITMRQSWFAQGVTLGHLLHSVSLAPGESTRMAVVDWTRKSRAGQTEVVKEEDALDQDTSRNRAMNEVTSATARDAQSGFSQSHQNSSSESAAVSVEASASYFGLASIDIAANYSTANSQAAADSYSTSSGSRDLSSEMTQSVNDRTHQNAHSTRSRRAAVVKEVSQNEHEDVSTRVLANYNHMHALTVQYYEVIQVYKTKVSVAKVDKVIFIPVKLVDFTDDSIVQRYRNVLGMASPTKAIREAIRDLDILELEPHSETIFSHLATNIRFRDIQINPFLRTRIAGLRNTTFDGEASTSGSAGPIPASPVNPTIKDASNISSAGIAASAASLKSILWNTNNQVGRLTNIYNIPVLRPQSDSIFLPVDLKIQGYMIEAEGITLTPYFGLVAGGVAETVDASNPLNLLDVSHISVKGSSPDKDITAKFQLQMIKNSVPQPVDLPAVTIRKGSTALTRIVTIKAGGVKAEVKKFLQANRMYYSTAILRALDTTQLALLLSGYVVSIKEHVPSATAGQPDEVVERAVPVSQVVEPKPIRYVGNYLAFKMNISNSDPDWASWLERRKLTVGYTTEDIVPLPSGGTFAEAVLGRYNCAEKLDITRFWNWQDSPIPLLPSDIAAIQTGMHDTSDGMQGPGSLSAPIINMTQPSSVPDPTGTAAVLSAIQNGSMFRDQSGLQGTIGLAQAATQATAAAATSAGQQNSVNMANAMQANTERQRIQAQKEIAMASNAGPNNSKGGLNHSQDGAKINYHDATTKAAAVQSLSSGTAGSSSGGTLTPSTSSGGSSSGSGKLPQLPAVTNPNPAFNAAVWGDGAPRSALWQQASGSDSSSAPQFEKVAAFSGDAQAAAPWNDLISFVIPDKIKENLVTRDITVQKIGDAMGNEMNLDFFPVQIDKFPSLTEGGPPATPQEFFFFLRTHFDGRFIDEEASKFYPFKEELDKAVWESHNPIGAVMGIKIPIDNAAVVCVQSEELLWRFMTVRTPFFGGNGSHPVSGTREWGMKPLPGTGGSWVFYTRGADRPTMFFESLLSHFTFEGGKKLWLSLQARTEKWIKDHGGQAKALDPTQKIITWDGFDRGQWMSNMERMTNL